MESIKEKKPMNDYEIIIPERVAGREELPTEPQRVGGYSAYQALGALLARKNKQYLFDEILAYGLGNCVRLIGERIVKKDGKLERGLGLENYWNISKEGKEHLVTVELAKKRYERHPDLYESPAQLYKHYEKRTKNMKEGQLDALYLKLCLKN